MFVKLPSFHLEVPEKACFLCDTLENASVRPINTPTKSMSTSSLLQPIIISLFWYVLIIIPGHWHFKHASTKHESTKLWNNLKPKLNEKTFKCWNVENNMFFILTLFIKFWKDKGSYLQIYQIFGPNFTLNFWALWTSNVKKKAKYFSW